MTKQNKPVRARRKKKPTPAPSPNPSTPPTGKPIANANRPYKRIGKLTQTVKATRKTVETKKKRLAVKTGLAQVGKTVAAARQLKQEVKTLTASVTLGADRSLSHKLDYLISEVEQLKRGGAQVERKLMTEGSLAGAIGLTLCILLIAPIGYGIGFAQRAKQRVVNAPFWLRDIIGLIQDEPATATSQDTTPLVKGDKVGPWILTSPWGPRNISYGSKFHRGVDVGTPIGTPLYAPVNADVECWLDGNGGGNVATLYQPGTSQVLHQALHLDTCTPGKARAGDVIATTGNTTGGPPGDPHLHWEEFEAGKKIPPTRGPLLAALGIAGDSKTVALIKELEQFSPTPSWDRHQYSWGYGTKAPGASGKITKKAAEQELITYLEQHCYPLVRPLDLAEHQAAAINSFCYNVGPEQFSGSKVYAHLRASDYSQAAEELARWTKSDGEELPGLVARRAKEKRIFFSK